MGEMANMSFPEFDSDAQMRDWFENADLSEESLERALEVTIAAQVELSVGEPAPVGRGNAGATGTLSEYHLVRS
jgi:hypothetical protein